MRSLLASVLAGGVSLGLLALPASGVHADSSATLTQLTRFHQMALDSSAGYVFLSEGLNNYTLLTKGADAASAIVVTDLSGNYVTTLDAGDGVEGITLSADGGTLYAALAADDAVAAIDVATIRQATPAQRVYPLGAGHVPYGVAVQSGKLWVSYDTGAASQSGIGDIDLGAVSPAFEADTVMGDTWPVAPDLAADPSDSGTLIAADLDGAPAPVASFDVSATPVIVRAPLTMLQTCGAALDLTVVPGGAQFMMACSVSYQNVAFSAADLSAQAQYAESGEPQAVAVATGTGLLAGASGLPFRIYLYRPGDQTAVNSFNSSSYPVSYRGLALSPDGSVLYAVTTGGPGFVLHVIDQPTVIRSTLSLSGPGTAVSGNGVTLTGRLTLGNGATPAAGTAITVTRSGPDGTITLPQAQLAADGTFTLTDDPVTPGGYTYTANYAGDATTRAASAAVTVSVALNKATFVMQSPGTVTFGDNVVIRGFLALTAGTPAAGTAVTVTRTQAGSTATKKWALTTGSFGDFTVSDPAPAKGTYTYTATYAGNTTTTPAKSAITITVARTTPSLAIITSARNYFYGTPITVTAVMNGTFADRTVSIYATPVRGTRQLIKTGTVDSQGELSIGYRLLRNTAFVVTFAGDAHNAPVTATRNIGALARVWMGNSGYYTSTTIGGGTYRVFHHTARLKATVIVTPNKQGQCVRFEMQQWDSKLGWSHDHVYSCLSLNNFSELTAYLTLPQTIGGRYRLRADYQRSATDDTNMSVGGPFLYFEVVK